LRFVQPRNTICQEAVRRGGVFVQPKDQKCERLLRRRFGARRPRIRRHVAESGSRCPAVRPGAGLRNRSNRASWTDAIAAFGIVRDDTKL
jgi:hypothetical protein